MDATTPPGSPDDYLTTPEVAEIIRMPASFVTKECRTGALPARKLGREWRVRRADLIEYMRPSNQPAATPRRRRKPRPRARPTPPNDPPR